MPNFIFELTGERYQISGLEGPLLAGINRKQDGDIDHGKKVVVVRNQSIRHVTKIVALDKYVTGGKVLGVVLPADIAKDIQAGDTIEHWAWF